MITGYCILGLLVSLVSSQGDNTSCMLVSEESRLTSTNQHLICYFFYLAAHGRNSVLSPLYSIWIVLWSSLPLPRYVCYCSWWVCSADDGSILASPPNSNVSYHWFHCSTYAWYGSEEREEGEKSNLQVVRCSPRILSLWLCNDVV